MQAECGILATKDNLWYRLFSQKKTEQSRVPPKDSGILQKLDSHFFLSLLPLEHTHTLALKRTIMKSAD